MRKRARRDQVGSWPTLAEDVTKEQTRVSLALSSVNAGLQTSPPKGDPTEIHNATSSWNALTTEIKSYLAETPSFNPWTRDDQIQRGVNYEAQIESWRAKFASMGAGVPQASPNPPAPAPSSSSDPFAALGNALGDLKWLAIAYLAYRFMKP